MVFCKMEIERLFWPGIARHHFSRLYIPKDLTILRYMNTYDRLYDYSQMIKVLSIYDKLCIYSQMGAVLSQFGDIKFNDNL